MKIILVLPWIFFVFSLYGQQFETISVEADTYLRQGSPNQNQGAEAIAVIQESGRNRTLLRFNSLAVKQASSGHLLSAKLRLYISQNANNWGSTGRDIGIYTLNDSWTEMGVTWNCRNDLVPANSSTDCPGEEWTMYSGTHPELHPYNATPIATTTITNNLTGNIELDITAYVQSIIDDSIINNGLMIKKITESQIGHIEFGTKESNVPAKLILTFETVEIPPTPTPSPPPVSEFPSALMNISQMSGEAPLTTSFNFSNIEGSNTSITLFFDDGSSEIYAGGPISHSFSEQGIYNVIAVIQDDRGHSTQIEETIIVTGTLPSMRMANSGIWITPNKLNPLIRQSGEKVIISGEICKVWKGAFRDTPICRGMSDSSIQITAYFPDKAHEVTGQVIVSKEDNRRFFRFETSELNPANLNQFTLVVGNIPPRVKELNATKVRLESRVQKLKLKISELVSAGALQEKIDRLLKSKTTLELVIAKIEALLSTRPEIISEYRLPLQVENSPSAQFYYAGMFAGFKLEAETVPGIKFENESGLVKMKITNLTNLSSGLPDGSDLVDFVGDARLTSDNDEHFYYAEIYYKGTLVHTSVPKIFNVNDTIEYNHSVASFSSTQAQDFRIDLFRKKTANTSQARRWGRLEFSIPVLQVRDTTPPVWLAPISPDENQHLFREFPEIIAHVKDSSGVLNLASASVKMNGAELPVATEILVDGIIKVSAVAPLNLPEGEYSIEYSIQDQGQNFATPNPLVRTFTIDHTPPIIGLNLANNQVMRTATFNLEAQISDLSSTDVDIFLNNVKLTTTQDSFITQSLTFGPGSNLLTILARDGAGNQTQQTSTLFYDNAPPKIYLSHQGSSLTKQASYQIAVKVEDQALTRVEIYQNTILVATQTAQAGASFNLDLALFEGANIIRILAIDSGNYLSEESVSITRDSIPPQIDLSYPSQNFITLKNNIRINGTYNENLASLFINNQSVAFDNAAKTFSSAYSLSPGTQTIEIRSVDSAGNEAQFSLAGESVQVDTQDSLGLFSEAQLEVSRSGPNTILSAPAGAVLVPNSKISISTNNGQSFETEAQSDGSFSASLNPFISANIIVTAPLIAPVFARFQAQTLAPAEPLTVQFFADPEGQEITEFTWNFGEGTSSVSGINFASFSYPSGGDYLVTLTVKNAQGAQNSTSRLIHLGSGMVAAFEVGSTRGNAPMFVALDAINSFDPAVITSYRFETNTGTMVENPFPFALMILETPGVHQITLKVKNAQNDEAISAPVSVTVNAPPSIALQKEILKAKAPSLVKVLVTAQDSDSTIPLRFRFNFGDGSPVVESTASSMEHIYQSVGNYNAVIEAFDSDNAKTSATIQVSVAENLAPTARLSSDVTTGHSPLNVQLDAGASTDDEGIVSYKWSVGSGPEFETSSPQYSITMEALGEIPVQVRTLDRQGLEAIAQVTVNVLPPNNPPVPVLAISPTEGIAPLEIELDASGSTDDFGIVEYAFVLSDGRRLSGPDSKLLVTFTNPGIYSCAVVVRDTTGVERASEPISITAHVPPRAYFLASPSSDTNPVTVSFNATQSLVGAPIISYVWSYGDGADETTTIPTTTHIYQNAGVFLPSLTVTDSLGTTNTFSRTITVKENHAPEAYLTQSTLSGRTPLTVSFNAQSSTDDSAITNYHFEFSDGEVKDQTGPMISKTFTAVGEQSVKLTVSDRQGLTSVKSAQVSVRPPNAAPLASFTHTEAVVATRQAFHVDGSASTDDSSVSAYRWNKGDGEIVTTRTPVAELFYYLPGIYAVTLVVIDDEGLPSLTSLSQVIRVNARPDARLQASLLEANPGDEISFDASGSTDSDGTIVLYRFTLDGSVIEQINPTLTHHFLDGGIKNIQVTVVDNDGAESTKSLNVKINSGPVAQLLASRISGDFPLSVNFNAGGSTDNEGITQYFYTYGDGDTLSTTSPTTNHIYQNPGEYVAKVKVFDRFNLFTEAQVAITVLQNTAPVANLSHTLSHQIAPAVITLDASQSSDNHEIVNFTFVISKDGSTVSQLTQNTPLASITIAEAGTYSAKVTAIDNQGVTGEASINFSLIQNTPPVAALTLTTPSPIHAPKVITFDASTSSDDEGIDHFEFEYGDGGTETLIKPMATSILSSSGVYLAKVRAFDRQGQMSEASLTYTVEPSIPKTEYDGPVLSFNPEAGMLNTNPESIEVDIEDASDIDVARFAIELNGTTLTQEKFSYDLLSKKLSINVENALTELNENILKVRAGDIFGNITTRAQVYVLDTLNQPDTKGPIFNFNPGGGELATLTPVVQIAASDLSGLDFSTLILRLNDIIIPETYYSIDQSQNRITVNFDQNFPLSDQIFSVVQIELRDTLGNLGIGKVGLDTIQREVVVIESGGQEALGVQGGRYHSCAVMESGGVKCWGRFNEGQAGYGTQSAVFLSKPPAFYGDVPLFTSSELASGEKVEQLVSIAHDNCILTNNGNVRCWGANSSGELGLGHVNWMGDNEPASASGYTSLLTSEELAQGIKVKKIAGNWLTFCALFTNGGVRCWGSNSTYLMGDKRAGTDNLGDNELPSSVPMISLGGPAVDISISSVSACARLAMPSGEEIRCWGHGGWGSLGIGYVTVIGDNEYPSDMTVFAQILSPAEKAQGRAIKSLTSSHYGHCVHFEDKGVRCWGDNNLGALGYPGNPRVGDNELPYTVGDVQILSPAELVAGKTVEILRNGTGLNTCAIISDGTLRCWGYNSYGSLGLGHTNVIGDNEYPYTAGDVPVFTATEIADGRKVADVLMGYDFTCIVSDLAQVKCFGGNFNWQLGLGNSAATNIGDYEFPSEVTVFPQILSASEKTSGRSISKITSGGDSHCTLFQDKGVRCWGSNAFGQIGYPGLAKIGDDELPSSVGDVQILSPAELSSGMTVEVIRQGGRHSCAILSTGALRCFGYNGTASLGLGHLNNIGDNEHPYTAGDISIFNETEISAGRRVVDAALGFEHTCMVSDLGQVKCWGSNLQNQLGYPGATILGDDELPSTYGYVDMGGTVQLLQAKTFDAGRLHTCAMMSDDNLRCWGRALEGQLGYGRTSNPSITPASWGNVPLFTTSEIQAGEKIHELIGLFNSNCVLTNFGHVRCFGDNASGALGLGHVNRIGDNEPANAGGFVSLLSSTEIAEGVLVDMIDGYNSTCAHLSNGSVRCFGPNTSYIIGNRTANTAHIGDNELPSSIPPLSLDGPAMDVTVSGVSACARLNMSSGEETRCWGNGGMGTLGLAATYGQAIGDNELPSSYTYVNMGGAVSIPKTETTIAAYFTADPQYGPLPLTVYFDASTSTSSNGAIVSYQWEIMDEITGPYSFTATTPTFSYTFLTQGTYVVKLTVEDVLEQSGIYERIVTVGDEPISPVAILSITPDHGKRPLNITFDASLSYSALGNLAQYHYYFGDGAELVTTLPTATHIYQNLGVYLARVEVTDGNNLSSTSFSQAVAVDSLNYAPVANLDCMITENTTVVCRTFGSYDSDGLLGAIRIDFGDGESQEAPLNGQDIFHTYSEPGVGRYTITAEIADELGLISTVTETVQYDFTAPEIALGNNGGGITNVNIFSLPITIQDDSFTSTRIYLNEGLIFITSKKDFTPTIGLMEGQNIIRIESSDGAGNSSEDTLMPITLDTIAPQMLSLSPNNGDTIERMLVSVEGTANEPLSSASANESSLIVNGNNLYGTINMPEGGAQALFVSISDIAGNTTNITRTVDVFRRNLIAELISIDPSSTSSDRLVINGAPDAARPGILVQIKTSIFGSDEIIAESDGSFSFETDYFDEVELKATDHFGRTNTVTKTYHPVTTLAGVVKDALTGNPIPGVIVTITSSGQHDDTDSEGVFVIPNPITGDHSISIDATGVVTSGRSYSKLELPVSLGNLQENALARVIYISPILQDGTETPITSGTHEETITVSSTHAPDVEIEISPTTEVVIPQGAVGAINIAEVAKNRTTVDVPEFAEPDTVYALEPSGLTLSRPTKITLPNVNEFPPGMQVVIMSKNSADGTWDADGLAVVSEDGLSIETIENGGIKHFSEIYAAPLGPKVAQIGAQDKPGADSFNGALTTSIDLPSYKTLGQDIAPGLIYKSTWAKPIIAVTNLFSIPENRVRLSQSAGGRFITEKVSAQATVESWIDPDFITAEFESGTLRSDPMKFTGIPRDAVISYAMDLSSQESGVQPYRSHYEVHLKQMILRTFTVVKESTFKKTKVETTIERETVLFSVFPPDLTGTTYIQNKINSSVGRGWKIKGEQSILNPESPRLMIEEGDGSFTSYVVNNEINTLYNPGTTINTVDLTTWPNVSLVEDYKNLKTISLESNPSTLSDTPIPPATGRLGHNYSRCGVWTGGECSQMEVCLQQEMAFTHRRLPVSLLQLTSGNFLLGDKLGQIIDSSNFSTVAGGYQTPPTFYSDFNFNWEGTHNLINYCNSSDDVDCGPNSLGDYLGYHYSGQDFSAENVRFGAPDPAWTWKVSVAFVPRYRCGDLAIRKASSGQWPSPDFADGAEGASKLNDVRHMIQGPGNTILISDFGNSRIRKLDLTTHQLTTIAGTGETIDHGDGDFANIAGIYHPTALARDPAGNIYIVTESGRIRKIDPSNRITTIAGKGGNFGFETKIEDSSFLNPRGAVYDNENNFLYVADTGHHRIVKLDFERGKAYSVGGNGSCDPKLASTLIGDGKPALEAQICSPTTLGLDEENNLLVFESGRNRIRRINFTTSEFGEIAFVPTQEDNSRLVRLPDNSFKRSMRSGNVINYRSDGKATSMVELTGNTWSFSYNDDGTLATQTDPVGSHVDYHYSGGKLEKIVDPAGRTTRFNYDGDKLEGVTYSDNSTLAYEYNGDGLLTSETNQRGHSTQYSYNDWKRLEKVTRPFTRNDGTPDTRVVTVNDSTSSSMGNNFTGGAAGQLKKFGTGAGEHSDSIQDARGNSTVFKKDETGYINTITDAEGQETIIERDLDGRPIKITRPDLSYVTLIYDLRLGRKGDLLSKFDSSTHVLLEFEYNSAGNLLKQTRTDENGKRTVVENKYFDDTNLLMSTTNKLVTPNQSVSFEYNSKGQIITKTDTTLNSTTTDYDVFGNVDYQKDQLGNELFITRDFAGNVKETKNAKGQIVKNEFDDFNRLTSVLSPKLERTEYSYYKTGELKTIKDPLDEEVHFTFNELSELTLKVDQLGRQTKIFYDSNSNVAEEIDPAGHHVSYERDNIDRVTKKILPDNVYEMAYDLRNNVKLIKDQNTEYRLQYESREGGDLVSRIDFVGVGTRTDLGTHFVSYTYDANSNRKRMVHPGGEVNYTFDAGNRLKTILNHKDEQFDLAFDNLNRITSLKNPVVESVLSFDATSFVKSIVHKKRLNAEVLARHDYSRDSIGNKTEIRSLLGTQSLSFDKNNQLTENIHGELGLTENFDFDEIGNRTEDNSGTYTYDPTKQRLQEDARFTYLFDDNGNMAGKISKTNPNLVYQFTHNSENRLTHYQEFDNNVIQKEAFYLYGATGLRIEKRVVDHVNSANSFTRRYLYDGQEIVVETDETNQKLAIYTQSTLRTDDTLSVDITARGQLKGLATRAGTFYFLKDSLGTITDLVDEAGPLVQHYVYSSFGNLEKITDASGNTIAPVLKPYFAFANRELDDETGLIYVRVRTYDPTLGQFIQRDPYFGNLNAPRTFINKYIYPMNNPLRYVDPSGRIGALAAIGIGAAVGAVLGGALAAYNGDNIGKGAVEGALLGATVAAIYLLSPAVAITLLGTSAINALTTKGNVGQNFKENVRKNSFTSMSTAVANRAFHNSILDFIGAIKTASDIIDTACDPSRGTLSEKDVCQIQDENESLRDFFSTN
ncbi:MAG: hypothetical protein A2X86_08065 [Bdellovibrionales bacterium GWA2_49_15]|nr:MAG: hypothetical protein A2X86_08065 [Bdellovibrionales bacterium GWA2_49_15]HAZ13275.1 hypothetical protein [Bdellovibrionales bacterium]